MKEKNSVVLKNFPSYKNVKLSKFQLKPVAPIFWEKMKMKV